MHRRALSSDLYVLRATTPFQMLLRCLFCFILLSAFASFAKTVGILNLIDASMERDPSFLTDSPLSPFAAQIDFLRPTVQRMRSLKYSSGRSILPAPPNPRFPYAVLIVYGDSTSLHGQHVCGGVLINSEWVLTAASCVMNAQNAENLHMGFGDDTPGPDELMGVESAKRALAYFSHPDFSGDPKRGNDIALIKLKTPENRSLPHLPYDEVLNAGKRLVGIGWGITEVNDRYASRIQVADKFDYLSHDQCAFFWGQTSHASAVIDQNVICVYPSLSYEGPRTICDGDEGGPLLFLDVSTFDDQSILTFSRGQPSNDIVYGIASFGPPECGIDDVSVYTNIATYRNWIENTISTFVAASPNDVLSSSSFLPQADKNDTLLMVVVLIGVGCGIALAIIVGIWFLYRRKHRIRLTNSIEISSLSAIKKSSQPNQTALMALSPFLIGSGDDSTPISHPSGESSQSFSLPMDIRVTLAGRLIGNGGFGRVEEGVYIDAFGNKHKVAVKFNSSEEARETLSNEIRVFERVGYHPNIVRCFGGRLRPSTEDQNGFYIVEELMEMDLGEYFKDPKTRRKTTFSKYLEIFRGIANGLEHLHKCEVIHFDLKPGNILLDENQQPKLADFGCSRQRARTYVTVGARGTIAYMAPELWLLGMMAKRAQVRAEKLDVFAFGVVMWECLRNEKPRDPMSMKDILEAEMQPLSEVLTRVNTNEDFRHDRFPFDGCACPDSLKAFIWECLSFYNNLRPSVQEIKDRIDELLQLPWCRQNIDRYQE